MSSEIRLTPTSYIVLGLIDAAGEATPYDLKQTVGLSLGNFWSLPHAQLYAEPERLAVAGLLSERRESGELSSSQGARGSWRSGEDR